MHYSAIRRPHFGRLHPGVLREPCRHDHVLIIDHPRRRHFKRLGQFKDEIRFADLPAFQEVCGRRHVLRIAFWRSRFYPRCDRIDLLLGQCCCIRKFSVMCVRKPRRHLPRFHGLPDCRRPRPRFLVGQHRKRSRFSRPMADLAILFEDRGYVSGESRSARKQRRRTTAKKRLEPGVPFVNR